MSFAMIRQGYDPAEVDKEIANLREQVQSLQTAMEEYKQQAQSQKEQARKFQQETDKLRNRLQQYPEDPSAISRALVIAQTAADELVGKAQLEAAAMIKEAKREAEIIVHTAKKDAEEASKGKQERLKELDETLRMSVGELKKLPSVLAATNSMVSQTIARFEQTSNKVQTFATGVSKTDQPTETGDETEVEGISVDL